MNTHQIINQEWAKEEITPIDSYCPIVVHKMSGNHNRNIGTIDKNNEHTADNKSGMGNRKNNPIDSYCLIVVHGIRATTIET